MNTAFRPKVQIEWWLQRMLSCANFSCLQFTGSSHVRPQSHSGDVWVRTNTNRHSLRIAHDRIGSDYFLLVRCHFRIGSATSAGQCDCFEMFKTVACVPLIGAYSYCRPPIHRENSCQFLLYLIVEHSYQFVTDSHPSVLLAWRDSIRRN